MGFSSKLLYFVHVIRTGIGSGRDERTDDDTFLGFDVVFGGSFKLLMYQAYLDYAVVNFLVGSCRYKRQLTFKIEIFISHLTKRITQKEFFGNVRPLAILQVISFHPNRS